MLQLYNCTKLFIKKYWYFLKNLIKLKEKKEKWINFYFKLFHKNIYFVIKNIEKILLIFHKFSKIKFICKFLVFLLLN